MSFNQTDYYLDYSDNGIVKLNGFGKSKVIGRITNRVFTKTIFSHLHLFKKTNSIGFNYQLVKGGLFDSAVITLDGKKLFITRESILSNGQVFRFKNNEPQIFVPLNFFEPIEDKADLSKLTVRGKPVYKSKSTKTLTLFEG
jgi:hypothetical protein